MSTGSTAIPLSAKRTQQRPNKVVCPMCDTVGFAPDTASGKEVRCANGKCLVPIFTAPDFAAPAPVAAEPPPSSLLPTLLTFGTVALILIAGASVWWFVLRKPETPALVAPVAITPDQPLVETPPTPEAPEVEKPAAPAPPSASETLAAVMKRWPAIAEDITLPTQQSLRRRYAAEAFALTGQQQAARKQIETLESLRSAEPFYRIAPLAYVAWSELGSGDEAAAKKTLATSLPLIDSIPKQGFDPARIVIDWSIAAVRLGDDNRARDLVRSPRDDAEGEQLLALLQSASVFNKHDLAAENALRPIVNWTAPKSVAATLGLLDRNAIEQARMWASGSPEGIPRAEDFAAWAEALSIETTLEPAAAAAKIRDAVASAAPAERLLVVSRAAVRAASQDRKPMAEAIYGLVAEPAGQITPGEPGAASSLSEFARFELPNQAAARLAAVALAEAAHAAALLGKTAEAQTFLTKALDGLKAAAPSEAAMAERSAEMRSLTISGVRSQLKKDLDLASDSDAEAAGNAYRRKVDEAAQAASTRTELQSEILARAVGWSLGTFVLAEAQRRSSEDGGGEKLLTGSAGGRLIGAFEKAGDRTSADAVRSTGVTNRDVPLLPAIELTLNPLIAEGKATEAARELYAPRWNRISSSEKMAVAIRTACQLSREKSAAVAFEFAKAIGDGNARLDVLRYLASQAAAGGQGSELFNVASKARLTSTEQAAVLRGLTAGLVDAGAASETAAAPAAGGGS